MAGGIIYDTNFYAALEAEVNAFRKALTKRWRKEVAAACWENREFRTAFHRYQAPYGEDLWDYWDPINRLHLIYGPCEVVEWAEGDQQSGVPSCPGRINAPLSGSGLLFATDRYGNEVVAPSEVTCGMNSIMQHVEYWAHAEGSAVLGKLPQFDRHDQRAIEGAQQALLTIGSTLGLESAVDSDAGFTLASNTDLINKVAKLVGENGENAGWYTGWTGLAATTFKDGFFASIAPTLHNQAGIAASIHNLYSARGTIIQEMRSGSLKILSDAGKALDETKEITTDLNPMWQTFQGMGTALSIAGAWNPPVAAIGASVQLIGIMGQNFAPKIKQTVYAHDVESVITALWGHLDEQADDLFSRENDYNNGIHALRDAVFGLHSFNLELYDLTENTATGNRDSREFHIRIDDVLELADTCFECAAIYEKQLIPKIAAVQAADASLATADGSEGSADPKVKAMVVEYGEYLRTACGRLYLAGEQIKAAAQFYAATDAEAKAAFDSVMTDWDEPPAPGQARDWAGDTDRSGWKVHIPGAPSYVNDTTPGDNDTSGQGYETEATR
ncbi:hypothetical protein [Actinoplanes utahensis]|uniref:Uncharacterized protein n=1 Tax=Actinoplanes utahensis TaxID=1869 RepID=A0A0A6UNQ2_ACTUT|nr:hypothetical protein [Actinoplanes utahensis]KHD75944.1 hypothetical protein MB27_20085 [Actinoplanes utahensis]GIF35048.1 hypothetical protein Aut01nite_80340 [Actinoplanes utahensis]